MATRKIRRISSSPPDPATRYARAVDPGEILAGPLVRAACRRDLADLRTSPKSLHGLFVGSRATAFKTDNGRSVLATGTGLHAPKETFLELGELNLAGFDLSLTGFGDLELKDLLAERTEGLTDPDDAPAAPEHPVSQTGDLWTLGKHRLLCGDSTAATDVERVLGGVAPHLMVTDPPYGVEYDPAWRNEAGHAVNGTTQRVTSGRVINRIKSRAVGKVANDDRADWSEAWVLFPGAVAYVWHAGIKASAVQDSLEGCGIGQRVPAPSSRGPFGSITSE